MARRQFPAQLGIRVAHAGLFVVLSLVMFLTGWLYAPDVLVRTEHSVEAKPIRSAQDARRSLGEPEQTGSCRDLGIPADAQCALYRGSDYAVVLVTP